MNPNSSFVTKLDKGTIELAVKNNIGAVMTSSCILGAALIIQTAQAQISDAEASAKINGDYAGSLLCSLGEMGMMLRLKDSGSATLSQLKQEPCRSGSGPSNHAQNIQLEKARFINGVLNFYPTVGNPDAPAGAVNVNGTVEMRSKYITLMNLEPGDWIEEPENFGSSGLIATLRNGKIRGKPTAQGCHTLSLRKLK